MKIGVIYGATDGYRTRAHISRRGSTGSFVAASQRLHVTQSTVSTRIQRLEETLGAELFVRNKAGTTLTPAGQQFKRHAALLTRTVEQARHEIGIVSGFRAQP